MSTERWTRGTTRSIEKGRAIEETARKTGKNQEGGVCEREQGGDKRRGGKQQLGKQGGRQNEGIGEKWKRERQKRGPKRPKTDAEEEKINRSKNMGGLGANEDCGTGGERSEERGGEQEGRGGGGGGGERGKEGNGKKGREE
eukprot:4998556-Pleurochrysis_carterae.AAC.1